MYSFVLVFIKRTILRFQGQQLHSILTYYLRSRNINTPSKVFGQFPLLQFNLIHVKGGWKELCLVLFFWEIKKEMILSENFDTGKHSISILCASKLLELIDSIHLMHLKFQHDLPLSCKISLRDDKKGSYKMILHYQMYISSLSFTISSSSYLSFVEVFE